MDEIFGKKPEIEAPAVASTTGGVRLASNVAESSSTTNPGNKSEKRKASRPDILSYLEKKLKLEEEKLKELRRFNDLFEESLKKWKKLRGHSFWRYFPAKFGTETLI